MNIDDTLSTQQILDEWKKVTGILETELNPMMYNSLICKIKPENLKGDEIDFVVTNPFIAKQSKKYLSLINDAMYKVYKKKLKINFIVRDDSKVLRENKDLGPLFISDVNTQKPSNQIEKQIKAGLAPKFTFESYLMGENNQLAYAIAVAVAERPGVDYNPFFLYSGVGLGKTHLIQAVGNKLLENNPKLNVVYTTGEAFTNELIESIQSGKNRGQYRSGEFRKKYRSADVLLVDDVQFIIGKDSTQDEFFHTFNTLYLAGKQIVLTSDRPPREFIRLEDRVISRFGSGVIADIQIPDIEMRNAILRARRDRNKDDVPNSVIDFLAENVATNVRELEGAYIQILTEAKTKGRTINIELAEEVLNKNGRTRPKKHINALDILKAVCKYYSVKAIDVKGSRRTKDIVLPRQVAMYLMKELTGLSLVAIGDLLGGRDHTTVMHGIDKIGDELKESNKIRHDLVTVKEHIGV